MKINKSIKAIYWVKIFLSIFLITILVIFLFNYIVDPYGKQNFFCELRYKPVLNERAKKYNDIFNNKEIENYDSIILGSSRVMKIMPSNFNDMSKVYNFGVHVANNAEKLFIIKEWLKVKRLKKIYLGIDYYNFNNLKRPLFINYSKFTDNSAGNYLSISTLKLSIKSLKNKLKNEPITFFNKDGSLNYFNKEKMIVENRYNFSKDNFIAQATSNIQANAIKTQNEIEEKVFNILKQIQEISFTNNIELYVFITPTHEEEIRQLIKYPNIMRNREYIEKKLVDIFGKVYNFSILHPYNKNRKNFYDIHHYRSFVGDKIIERLNNKSSDYGVLLKGKNAL